MEDTTALHPAIRGLKTVCRCNNIKYRTIETAIRSGAESINDVATRTTATTGHCGGSCTPQVQRMIKEIAVDGDPGVAGGGSHDEAHRDLPEAELNILPQSGRLPGR